jgi:hypothetical protein
MAAAPTPHAGSRATSLCVRIGVAALLLLFYVDAFLRTGAWFSWVLFGVLLVPAAIGLIVTTRDLPGALRPRVGDIAFALVAALTVAVGVRELGLAPVVAAALVGIVAAVVSTLHNRLAAAAVPL